MNKSLPKRKCKFSGCNNTFQKVRPLDMFCCPKCHRAHQDELNAKKAGKGTKKKFIAPVSQRMLSELSIYRPIRDGYLSHHETCEVRGCENPSNNLHHKAGRTGYADQWAKDEGVKLLWDVRFFMACCGSCHPRRIHENPEWATQEGYMIKFHNT